MDLHLGLATASPVETRAVDVFTSTLEEVNRSDLLGGLWALQAAVGGVTAGGLNELCRQLVIPPADAYGVATFYDLINTSDSQRLLRLCDDIVCRRQGSEDLAAVLEDTLGPQGWVRSSCIGQCERAPAVLTDTNGLQSHAGVTEKSLRDIVAGLPGKDLDTSPIVGDPGPLLAGAVDSTISLGDYRASGGIRGLDRAIQLGPEEVLASLGGLVGRGGAAFPTVTKWRSAMGEPGPRHVIANADESEPGTFKDRVLLERDPFAVLEGLMIAGHVVGAGKGWLYIRGEYPHAESVIREAIVALRRVGLLGTEGGFDIEVRRGAGAYICGEETALFNSIEGLRGEPRHKPPFPTQSGLFGQPTVINNVETLATVSALMRQVPSAGSTKLFSVTGVGSPGVIEVPLGTSLGDLIDRCGGIGGTGSLGAVLVGGAAGTFVTDLSLRLDFGSAREAGLGLGSGAILVFDAETDFHDIVLRIARFFAHESCGQCVPCRIGTARQVDVLASSDLTSGRTRQQLADLDAVMTDASICGLGQTAASAVRSAISLGLIGAP